MIATAFPQAPDTGLPDLNLFVQSEDVDDEEVGLWVKDDLGYEKIIFDISVTEAGEWASTSIASNAAIYNSSSSYTSRQCSMVDLGDTIYRLLYTGAFYSINKATGIQTTMASMGLTTNTSQYYRSTRLEHYGDRIFASIFISSNSFPIYEYSIENNSWTLLRNVTGNMLRNCGNFIDEDGIWWTAGGTTYNTYATTSTAFGAFNTSTSLYTALTGINTSAYKSVFKIGSYVYSVGGLVSSYIYNSTTGSTVGRIYDIEAGTQLTTMTALPYATINGCGITYGGLGYVFGGRYKGNSTTRRGFVSYNPDTNTWTDLTTLTSVTGALCQGITEAEYLPETNSVTLYSEFSSIFQQYNFTGTEYDDNTLIIETGVNDNLATLISTDEVDVTLPIKQVYFRQDGSTIGIDSAVKSTSDTEWIDI